MLYKAGETIENIEQYSMVGIGYCEFFTDQGRKNTHRVLRGFIPPEWGGNKEFSVIPDPLTEYCTRKEAYEHIVRAFKGLDILTIKAVSGWHFEDNARILNASGYSIPLYESPADFVDGKPFMEYFSEKLGIKVPESSK